MTVGEAIILGIIQGIFMFFPVSSTSHLVLFQHWLLRRGSLLPPPDSPEMIAFDLVVHVGTVLSILFVFRISINRIIQEAWENFCDLKEGKIKFHQALHLKLIGLGLFSVFITGIIGLPMQSFFTVVFGQPIMIAITLTITGILLWTTDILPKRPKGLRDITLWMAFIIGFAQALALLPGISRSGITIVAALLVGLKRRWAAEFSFFIAIPTILGATLVHSLQVFLEGGFLQLDWTIMLIGFFVAAIVGIAALYLVITLLYRAKFRYFSYYVWTLAAIIIFSYIFNWW